MIVRCGLLKQRSSVLRRLDAFRQPWRSVASQARLTRENINVPVGVSGPLRLDVISHGRFRGPGDRPRNLLVHFPPGISPSSLGPLPQLNDNTGHELCSQIQSSLGPETALVTVNYRLSPPDAIFPTPIHDASTALDYLTSPASPLNHGHDAAPQICLLGSHVGGALAAMLALTKPNAIRALAAIEPVVDWVILDEIQERLHERRASEGATLPRRKKKQRKATLLSGFVGDDDDVVLRAVDDLVRLRARCFRTPSAYFDPFASPTLFLRAPGRDTPLPAPAPSQDNGMPEYHLDDVDDGTEYEPDPSGSHNHRDWGPASPNTGPLAQASHDATATVDSAAAPNPQPRRRKVGRRWPPVGRPESVLLPHVKVLVRSLHAQTLPAGHAALMRAQGTEFVELLRRAASFGREAGFAAERVTLEEEGEDDAGDGETRLEESTRAMHGRAVEWLNGMFDGGQ